MTHFLQQVKKAAHSWAVLTAIVYMSLLFASALISGCTKEETNAPFIAPPDTSFMQVVDLSFFAFDDRGAISSGFTMQWWEYFYSNYSKNCQIERYVILDQKSDTIFDAGIGSPSIGSGIIVNGDKHYARTKKVDIADSAVAGSYDLHIYYRHSAEDFHWDSSIFITANQFTDSTAGGE